MKDAKMFANVRQLIILPVRCNERLCFRSVFFHFRFSFKTGQRSEQVQIGGKMTLTRKELRLIFSEIRWWVLEGALYFHSLSGVTSRSININNVPAAFMVRTWRWYEENHNSEIFLNRTQGAGRHHVGICHKFLVDYWLHHKAHLMTEDIIITEEN